MPKVLYNIKVKTSEYMTDNGERKGHYEDVGVVLQEQGKAPYILMKKTFSPAGVPSDPQRDNVLLSLFEPKPRDDRGTQGSMPF